MTKYIYVLATTITVLGLILVISGVRNSASDEKAAPIVVSYEQQDRQPTQRSNRYEPGPDQPSGKPQDENNSASHFPSPEDWQEVMEFHRYDTSWGGREKSEYHSYTESQLQVLADSGDILAMKELAYRYAEVYSGRSVNGMQLETSVIHLENGSTSITHEHIAELKYYEQKMDKYTEMAILHGDRELLSMAPGVIKARRPFYRSDDPADWYNAAIEALAQYEFMGMRGMKDKKYEHIDAFLSTHSKLGQLPAAFTDKDIEAIRRSAQEIYDDYEQRRLALGLGPFDNSVPSGKAQELAWWIPQHIALIEEVTGYRVNW